jgi:hypothetical protein
VKKISKLLDPKDNGVFSLIQVGFGVPFYSIPDVQMLLQFSFIRRLTIHRT